MNEPRNQSTERDFIGKCREEFAQLITLSQDKALYEAGQRVSLAHAIRTRATMAIAACDKILQERQ